jgi:hypothetical protein
MLDYIPIEILPLIIGKLQYSGVYNLLLTNKKFNYEFGKDKFKKKYQYLLVKRLVNCDLHKFKKEIINVSEKERHEIFLASIHNIRTIWLNEQQGFYDMKYILECMVHGSRIININELTNHTSNHFNKHFYDSIVDCIGFLTTEDREKIQKNIDYKPVLRSLHSNFRPIKKIFY